MAGAHGGLQALGPPELRVAGQHAMHDLTRIEDDRLAAGFAEMAREAAVRMLDRELPVHDTVRPRDEVRSLQKLGSRQKRLHDVTAGLGVTRQPAILEAPSCRDATGIRHAGSDILRAAKPFDGRGKVLAVMAMRLRIRTHEVACDQPRVTWPPRPIAKR